MHITHALGRINPGRLRVVTTLVAAVCATMALAAAAAAPADAAGPNYLSPGQTVTYPTWGWGATKVCASNYYSRPGMVDVVPWYSDPPGQHDEIYVSAYSTKCIDRWWFGVYIDVTNISHIALGTYPTLKVWTR